MILRGRIFLGCTFTLLGVPAAQAADCSSTYDCTVTSGSYGSPFGLDSTGSSGSQDDDPGNGAAITITNQGDFTLGASSYPYVLHAQSTGGTPVDESTGGAGGAVTIGNDGDLSLSQGSYGSELIAIDARSVGADADRDNQNNGSPGGDGGAAGNVSVTSTGSMVLGGSLPHGGIGIYALSQGGTGGEGNTDFGVNQPGGHGGAAGTVTVTNQGAITMGSSSAPVGSGERAWGIRAESNGGGGDPDANEGDNDPASGNGAGGNTVTIENTGAISLHVDGTGSSTGGVKGIYASSTGGNGAQSSYNFNTGGSGGSGGSVNVDVGSGGDIDVSSARALADGGAGVHVLSSGGDGGLGNKQDDDGNGRGGSGGNGGSVAVNVSGAAITTSGDHLVGVLATTTGGDGGSGDSENQSSGGSGGSGGAIQINLEGNGTISTAGDYAYGILGQSIGGFGGDGGDDSALFGSSGSAGPGGDSSPAGAFTTSGTRITTSGDYAAGIAFQSIGGGGGTGGDFVDVLGGAGGNGGNGGDGIRSAVNSSSTIETSGDHAYGILSQAIAGSGGHGGVAAGLGLELGGDGGSGGTGGTGGILNYGSITTQGYAAHGIVLQSIGGGGGAAGSAGGLVGIGGNSSYAYTADAGALDLASSGQITTNGEAAIGIVMQSIGGGGGSGGGSTGLATIGGKGSGGGKGGTVIVNGIGPITTHGRFAHGLLAQSVGGGGGNGGSTLDFSALVPAVGIGGSSGNGGAGGTVCLLSYAADSTNCQQQGSDGPDGRAATVITTGDAAIGVLAQSIGGGGGNGGDATGYSGESIFNLQVGGNAGTASAGGVVDVFLRDLTIQTSGARSMGLVAHSVGGGGGNGGAASGYDGGVGYAAGLSVGGVGGSGGSGGAVTVNLQSGTITTGEALASGSQDNQTTDAYGIVAQSVGGGGGNGGAATSDDIDVAVPTGEGVSLAATMAMAVGGKGGSGGSGGSVLVDLSDNSGVSTFGQGSHGLIAQSIGGGGGNGGNSQALSATVGDGDTVAADVSVAVGGSGSGGGNGGSVQVAIGSQDGGDATTIQTADDYANAVLAQSIGGGGGNAGVGSSNTYKLGGAVDMDLDIGLGGTGGSGSAGGAVGIELQPDAVIVTHGSGSRGIVAQSIGGGGGASQGGTVMLGGVAKGYSGDVEVGVGRKGGGGGTGSTVTIDSHGTITTAGGDADGILAQSIGGGGGLGGSMGNDASADHQLAQEVSLIKDGESTYTFTTYVGGQGGSGANAGAVVLDTSGTIRTGGDWADGIVAQSIGGGGGVGGTATASGSLAKATTEIGVGGQGGMAGAGGGISGTIATSITTGGYSAFGLLAQSIGGGGGQGGDGSDKANVTVQVGSGSGVGGSGGASGNGGSVDLTVTGTVTTAGDDAHGLVLQSIGSGGGTGGAGSSAGMAEDIDVTVTVGGRGGGSGAGGAVTLEGAPTVATTGERAFGIVLQSVGGGGGIGGTGSAANIASLTLGGNGGSGVDGGTVTAHLDGGHVTTSGQGAHGVVLQSIGGGGGIGGDSSGVLAMGGSGGNSTGNGGDVSYDAATSITTTGTGAFGIVAQSIGGGGGLGGSRSGAFAGSTRTDSSPGSLASGTVSVLASGDIRASGENAIGIFAQSDAVAAGKVTVEVSGAVAGGSGSQAAGIHVDEGSANTLTIDTSGSVTSASGVAVRYTADNPGTAASLSITNNGTIDGSLNDATIVSGNQPAARLAATTLAAATTLPRIRLDNRGTVMGAAVLDAQVGNGGRLIVGTAGKVDATEITGDFVQTATGRIVADLDLAKSTADRLVVRGDAELAGRVEVAAITLLPGRSAEVLTVAGTARGELEAADSPIFDYRLDRVGNAHRLSVERAGFEDPLAGRSMNERRLARHLQAAWDLGGTPDLAALFADLDTATQGGIENYGETLYGLTPGVAPAPAARAQAVMQDFADSLFSCPTFAGASALVREGSCVWAQVGGGSTDQDAAEGAAGFAQDGFTYQLGMQNELAAGWYLGVSAAYREDRYDGGNARSSGDSALAGITVKHQQGPWLLGLGLSGGYGWFDTSRTVAMPDGQAVASSDPEVQNLGLRARAAYELGGEHFYLRPALDLDAIYTRQPAYREFGADALDLVVEGSDQWGLVATPSLELGGRLDLAQGWMFRPYLRGGVSFADQSSWRSVARLAGAPDGAGSFATEVPIDEVAGRVDTGLQILNGGDVAVRVQYEGEFSDNVTSHGGSLRVDFRF